jgi:hypothetical protein
MRKTNERMDKRQSHLSRYRAGYCGVGSLAITCLVGCAQIKKMALVGGVTSVTAGAASALGLATVPTALVTGVAGAAASAAGAIAQESTKEKEIMTNCAPDNLWTVAGVLIEQAALWIGLCALACIAIGWLLPGPLTRKKKE